MLTPNLLSKLIALCTLTVLTICQEDDDHHEH